MTYFEARRIEALFRRYRQLALDYWAAVGPPPPGMVGPNAPTQTETNASRPLRQEISTLLPQVQFWADRLGVGVVAESHPPPILGGGPVIPVNLLACVTDRRAGYRNVSRDEISDTIDQCIGAAIFVKGRLLARLLKPWCWLVDVPALIVGWPFYVMRKAGVPDKIIESTGAQVVKAILTGLLWLAGFLYAVYRTGLAAAIQAAIG